MHKRMKIMLIGVTILFGSIFLYKMIVGVMIKKSMAQASKDIMVSAMTVEYSTWKNELASTGSLRAIRGVNVTTELAGMVQTIYFKPGMNAAKDEILVQLNADPEIAQLHALEASVELAMTTLRRDKSQYAIRAVSQQTLDADEANLKNLRAQVAQQAAIVAKKTIRAPFAGRLGINNVNPGQYLNPGDNIVTLQTLDPIFVDFYMPQQKLANIKLEQPVIVTSNAYPHKSFKGKITTVNPAIDVSTRNVLVEATVLNAENELIPGMFAHVKITTGEPVSFLTIPQTAVAFNSYGNIVYVVKKSGKEGGAPVLTAMQHFVTTGETRGEQIQVLKGLKKNDLIVTSGQLKLKNNSPIAINDSIAPSNNPAPDLKNNH